MKKRNFFRNLLAVAAFLAAGGAALAQSAECSALSRRAGKPRAGRRQRGLQVGTRRPRAEIGRLVGYYRLDRLRTRPARVPVGSPAGRMRPDRPAHPSARSELRPAVAPSRQMRGGIEVRRRQLAGRDPADLLGASSRAASSRPVRPAAYAAAAAADHARGAADHHRGRSTTSPSAARRARLRADLRRLILPALQRAWRSPERR